MTCSAAAGCATVSFELPAGTPTPRADAPAIWDEASRACRDLGALGGELRASGRADGQKIPGLRLGTAFTASGQIAVEARVSATAVFSLRGTAGSATLVLPQDRRVVTGATEELLDALVGLPIGPERLMRVLAGCVSAAPAESGEAIGGVIRVRTADAVIYVIEQNGRWRVRAGAFGGLEVAYQLADGPLPRQVRLSSRPGRMPAIDLILEPTAMSSEPRPDSVFAAIAPAGYDRVTPAWLRENSPFRRTTR